ncbi:MAG: DEAD/DEAH box helicase, partial [Peptococcaceae bacterium]|nr:DEAD/DEAH box helicase [Peptococcaceae bacterium]
MYAAVLILNTASTRELILTYAIREGQSCLPGMLYSVHVRGRAEKGLVLRLQHERQRRFSVRYLEEALFPDPVVSRQNLALARWLARYYVCPLNRVAALFLPPAVRPVKETRYFAIPLGSDRAEAAETPTGAAGAAEAEGAQTGAMHKKPAGAAGASEAQTDAMQSADASEARSDAMQNTAAVGLLFVDPAWQPLWDGIGKAGKRGISAQRVKQRWGAEAENQAEKWALAGYLRKETDFRQTRRDPSKQALGELMSASLSDGLSPDQLKAYDCAGADLREGKPGMHLLFGVTGSGKTEVYLRLASLAKKLGKQTIYMVPEISLVPQLIAKASQWFGKRVAVLHSNLTASQRFSEWQRIRNGEVSLIVGPRSALFAPV